MRKTFLTEAVLAIGLAGCGREFDPATPDIARTMPAVDGAMANTGSEAQSAVARLRTAAGAAAGSASVTRGTDGLSLTLRVTGLPPGEHGVHIHMTGRCDAPAFASAGSHWNPVGKQHGLDNPEGRHAGDMPNLLVNPDDAGSLTYMLKGATLEGIGDADGSALVVHASADDQKTDPSGNSGARIACGVFQ